MCTNRSHHTTPTQQDTQHGTQIPDNPHSSSPWSQTYYSHIRKHRYRNFWAICTRKLGIFLLVLHLLCIFGIDRIRLSNLEVMSLPDGIWLSGRRIISMCFQLVAVLIII